MAKLELNSVSKVYNPGRPNEVKALDGVTFAVEEGDYLAITGTSGSGKSTLLSIMGLLDNPSDGEMSYEGSPTSMLSESARTRLRGRAVTFIFQKYNLLDDLSAREQIEVPLGLSQKELSRKECRERAGEMLAKVGVSDLMDRYPDQMSGGEQQRVAIARALAFRPGLILADEPTGSLDTESGEGVLELFDQLHDEGNTLVVVTHDKEVSDRAARRIELSDGRATEVITSKKVDLFYEAYSAYVHDFNL